MDQHRTLLDIKSKIIKFVGSIRGEILQSLLLLWVVQYWSPEGRAMSAPIVSLNFSTLGTRWRWIESCCVSSLDCSYCITTVDHIWWWGKATDDFFGADFNKFYLISILFWSMLTAQVIAIDNFVNAVIDPTGKTDYPESLIRFFKTKQIWWINCIDLCSECKTWRAKPALFTRSMSQYQNNFSFIALFHFQPSLLYLFRSPLMPFKASHSLTLFELVDHCTDVIPLRIYHHNENHGDQSDKIMVITIISITS